MDGWCDGWIDGWIEIYFWKGMCHVSIYDRAHQFNIVLLHDATTDNFAVCLVSRFHTKYVNSSKLIRPLRLGVNRTANTNNDKDSSLDLNICKYQLKGIICKTKITGPEKE